MSNIMPTAISPGSSRERFVLSPMQIGFIDIGREWFVVVVVVVVELTDFLLCILQITGRALDSNGTPCYVIRGNWDDKFTFAKVIGVEGKNLVTDTAQTLWQADPPE